MSSVAVTLAGGQSITVIKTFPHTSSHIAFLIRAFAHRRFVRRIGFRLRHRHALHILCSAISQERFDRPEHYSNLVGKYRLHQHRRLSWHAIQEVSNGRNLRSVKMVERGSLD
jgi:hypothetical protein